MSFRRVLWVLAGCLVLPTITSAQDPAVNIDPFFATVDANRDGEIAKNEWKQAGLMDIAFPLCDPDKNDRLTKQEMSVCAVPESMDPKKEGVLTVYARGRFVIASPGAPIPKPQNAPPGITQATQMGLRGVRIHPERARKAIDPLRNAGNGYSARSLHRKGPLVSHLQRRLRQAF